MRTTYIVGLTIPGGKTTIIDPKNTKGEEDGMISSARAKSAILCPLALASAFGLVSGAAYAQASDTSSNPFIANAKAGYMFRTSYFDRRSDGDAVSPGFTQQGMGIGGWLWGNTGEINNMLSFGGTYNFTVPLYSPDENPYNFILRDPKQSSVSVLGEANVRFRYGTHNVVLGRQSINQQWFMEDVARFFNKLDQSMIGRRDVRAMHPIHYEAATIQGRFADETVRYYAGYVDQARQINDNDFRNLYQAVYQITVWPEENKTGDSDGALYGGVQWRPHRDMMLEGSYYALDNLLNMVYIDFDYVHRLENNRYVRFGTQFMYQEGNGDALMSNIKDFDTNYWGIYGETRLIPWLAAYGMAGITDDGEDIRSPYSIGPSYLVQRFGENSRAGERTWIVGALFDFTPLGARGLQFDISYGERTDRHLAAHSDRPLPDWDEVATDLIYTFPQDSPLKNMRARARYAKVWEKGPAFIGGQIQNNDRTTDDTRFDISWNIPFN